MVGVKIPIWKHLRAIAFLPGMAILVIPSSILFLTKMSGSSWFGYPLVRVISIALAALLISVGLLLMAQTISMFVRIGKGTLAPWDATSHMVLHGVYRHVRNPMISGVFCILLGESVLFGSIPLFIWFVIFVLMNAIYIPFIEEPGLEERFGEEYLVYKKNVPRWIPLIKPWIPPSFKDADEKRRE